MRFQKLDKVIRYTFKITFRSIFTHIFIFIIPFLIELFIYFYLIKQNIISNRAIVCGPLIFITIIFNSLFVTNSICSWRETIFIKQIKNFGINNLTFLTSLLVVFFTYSMISLIIISSVISTIDAFSFDKKVLQMFGNVFTQPSFLLIFIGIILNIAFVYFIAILIAGFFRNVYLINALFVLVVMFLILTGDYLLDYKFTQSFYYQMFSFLNPQKYLNWIFYTSYTNTYTNSASIYKILKNVEAFFPFTNLFAPLFSSVAIIPVIGLLSYYNFNISIKK
ncbi:hypothetical protein STABA_v1c08220 [Spiroplasma tabanidicola]|uniref:Uncharacterized protein n=1 Tax=Spiroplasma tabanidicola TaxID=324079 RepID=A0A6I6C5P2_9MOLU|nr:hypothetical protein STABA_v1c08220 [Spiroplasma tabanidicola]